MALQLHSSPRLIADHLIDILWVTAQDVDPEEILSFEPWLKLGSSIGGRLITVYVPVDMVMIDANGM